MKHNRYFRYYYTTIFLDELDILHHYHYTTISLDELDILHYHLSIRDSSHIVL